MADIQTKVDAEKARIVQQSLGANAPALQGMEFELPQYNSPVTELQALDTVANGESIIDRAAPQTPIVAPDQAKQIIDQQIAEKRGELGLPGGVAPAAQVPVTADQLQIANQPQQASPLSMQPSGPGLAPYNKAVESLNKAAQVGELAAAQENAYVDGYDKKIQEFELKQQAERASRQKEVDDKILAAQQEVEKISSGEIDPNRVFSNMSTAQKFGNVILAAIAGNRGIETLDRMVRMDVAAQENNKNSKLSAAKDKVSIYQDFRNKLKDDFLAAEATKASMYQVAQMKLQSIQNQTKNAQVAATIQNQIAELELKKQETVQKYAEHANKLAAQQSLQAVDPITAKINMLPDSAQKPLLEAKEVYDNTQAAFKTIDSIFAEAEGIGGIEGNIPFSDKKAQVAANNANIESAIRATMKGQGTIQEAEIDRLVKPLLPLPTDSVSVIRIKNQKLKQLLTTKNAGQIGRLRNMGLLPKEFSPTSAKKN
jgi:hypothetical protein